MAISARGLIVERGGFRLALDTFDAHPSGTALLGRNGAGKSTLLLAIQGLIDYRGTVERPARSAGVFAQPAVLHGSVLWNVSAVARGALGLNARSARCRARRMLTCVGLDNVLDLDARQLSSGQRQRLALARALILEPQALFLDEPFANVDADGRPSLRDLVHDYITHSGCSFLLATQNLADVVTLCHETVVLEAGRISETRTVGELATSTNSYLQALVRESRVLA